MSMLLTSGGEEMIESHRRPRCLMSCLAFLCVVLGGASPGCSSDGPAGANNDDDDDKPSSGEPT
ncbi:MAG: hypothetical protein B7733_22110, partial [Myxococcales bacterium FL481]